jgi:hypothetical protein
MFKVFTSRQLRQFYPEGFLLLYPHNNFQTDFSYDWKHSWVEHIRIQDF